MIMRSSPLMRSWPQKKIRRENLMRDQKIRFSTTRVLVVRGISSFCKSLFTTFKRERPELVILYDPDVIDRTPRNQAITSFSAVAAAPIVAYKTNEVGLQSLLAEPTYSRTTKILSCLLSLFEYVERLTPTTVTIISYSPPATVEETSNIIEELSAPAVQSTGDLAKLVLWMLGPAYTRAEMITKQITKRAGAIAAALQVGAPSDRDVSDSIQATNWVVEDNPNIVNEMLGITVCIKPDDTYDPDSVLTALAGIDDLARRWNLSTVAQEILSQMRMIYMHYHATSVNFIPALVTVLTEIIPGDDPVFRSDLAHYRQISGVIENSPYMGMRGILPDQYQIRQFPCLVFTSVLYYKNCLPTPEAKSEFDNYAITSIEAHVTKLSDRTYCKMIADLLPFTSIAAIVKLMATAPSSQANSIMAGRSELEKNQIISSLRQKEHKGQWMTEYINRENSAYERVQVDNATRILRELLQDSYNRKATRAQRLDDPVARRRGLDEIDAWRDDITKRINGLLPIAARFDDATTTGQTSIRMRLGAQMETIARMINQEQEIMEE